MSQRIELRPSAGAPVVLGLLLVFPLVLIAIAPAGVKLVSALASVGLVWMIVALARRRLVLDDTGVAQKGVFGTTRFEWNEVDHYTYWSMDQTSAYAVGGAQGGVIGVIVVAIVVSIIQASRRKGNDNRRFGMGRMKIVSRDGRSVAIDTRWKQPTEALERAFTEVHARLRAGQRRDFRPFALTDTELVHDRKGRIGLADIEKVDAAGSRLTVKKRGKRLAWAAVGMKNLTNGMLFLEELAERGITVHASAGVFVPPTVLDKLRAAASRQAALPQARVVERPRG
jgi:hypothetical protein